MALKIALMRSGAQAEHDPVGFDGELMIEVSEDAVSFTVWINGEEYTGTGNLTGLRSMLSGGSPILGLPPESRATGRVIHD